MTQNDFWEPCSLCSRQINFKKIPNTAVLFYFVFVCNSTTRRYKRQLWNLGVQDPPPHQQERAVLQQLVRHIYFLSLIFYLLSSIFCLLFFIFYFCLCHLLRIASSTCCLDVGRSLKPNNWNNYSLVVLPNECEVNTHVHAYVHAHALSLPHVHMEKHISLCSSPINVFVDCCMPFLPLVCSSTTHCFFSSILPLHEACACGHFISLWLGLHFRDNRQYFLNTDHVQITLCGELNRFVCALRRQIKLPPHLVLCCQIVTSYKSNIIYHIYFVAFYLFLLFYFYLFLFYFFYSFIFFFILLS